MSWLDDLSWIGDAIRTALGVPTVVSFTATGTKIVVHKDENGVCVLQYGDFPAGTGISFEAVVDVPAGSTGVLEFVQDIIPFRKHGPGLSSGTECFTSKGARVRDRPDPYEGPLPVGPGRHTFRTEDSPSTPLPFYERKEVSDQFRMFLMWTSDRFPVRVALGKIEWMWMGVAESTAKPGDCAQGPSAWERTSNGQSAGDWSEGGYPVLSPTVDSISWGPC